MRVTDGGEEEGAAAAEDLTSKSGGREEGRDGGQRGNYAAAALCKSCNAQKWAQSRRREMPKKGSALITVSKVA